MTTEPYAESIRVGCCDTWPKPCTYHEGYEDGYEAGVAVGRDLEAAGMDSIHKSIPGEQFDGGGARA